ncbi:MAG TPA: helix-hairpin-helix domain-containing protein [Anaerolineae bacterium]|nr:helix-hairpin-helix domain-containing protein [Anaerolineae bacterium]
MARGPRAASGDERPVTTSDDEAQPAAPGRRPILLAVLLTSLAWLIVAGGAVLAWRQPQPVAFQVQPPPATATPAPTPTPAPIKVEVAGAVQQPGVYELPASARAADAIAAAGGLAPNADGEALSLARPLQDGEKLAAPTVRPAQPAAATSSTPELAAARSGGSDLSGAGLINLNSASAQELEALPAIGPVTAQAIVDYRTANGPFQSVEEITKVKGIGPATLEKLKPLITVGE